MSYIINSTSPFVSIKLTEKGRESLASGRLNFASYAVGDSEINYDREYNVNPTDVTLSATSKIMRPFDRQPNIKSFITTNGTTNLNTLNPSQVYVVKAVVNNEATERGFFANNSGVFTTLSSTEYAAYTELISDTVLTGGTILQTNAYSAITVGDFMLLKASNDTAGSITANENDRPLPNLWYKVKSMGVGYVEVDRNLPTYSANTASSQVIFYKNGEVYDTISTGNTTAYWDSGTLSFNSSVNVTCHDVPVWNMNNVWCENIAGMTGGTTSLYEDYTKFGSYPYLGTKNPYLEYLCQSTATTVELSCTGPGLSYPDDVSKSISIIHYTNNAISSLYGEFLYIDTTNSKVLKLHLPDLMYHRRDFATGTGTTMGMTFISSGLTYNVGTSDIEYVNLIEDPTFIPSGVEPKIVGRVYPQLKTVVIHNDEIVAAISYKSNRNWTLPSLSANIATPSGGTSTGVLNFNETMYLTYILENTTGTGLTTSLLCQDYIKVTNTSSKKKDIEFKISEVDSFPYMRKIEDPSYDGLGFHAYKFKLVYQIVQDPSVRPDSNAWKVYDFTSTSLTTNPGESIDPVALENQIPASNGFLLTNAIDSAATTFDIIQTLNMAPNTSPNDLQFGDERFFYGNLETYIGATIYKTIFNISLNSGQFNTTSNPTRTSTSQVPLTVSEIGIYDSTNNLVLIGKLSTPLTLSNNNTIMIELSIDF
jgi:hypothetical protein